jgi:Pentapeptide repeats (8 copies)
MARSLKGSDLRGRRLDGFHLASRDLRRAQLQEATARRANLTGADLSRAFLTGADFRDATMVGAKLVGGKVVSLDDETDAPFKEVVREILLESSTDAARLPFTGADFQLRRSQEGQADTGARGADLRGASGLRRARLEEALFDSRTRWPKGFPLLESGAVDATRHGAFNRERNVRTCRRGSWMDYVVLFLGEECIEAGPRPLERPLPTPIWLDPSHHRRAWDGLHGLKTRPRSPSEYDCEL